MLRSHSLFALIMYLSVYLISCKEDEIPSRAVFGEPDAPIVFNLKVLDPEIPSKGIELVNYQFGTVRLIDNTYIIYEPNPDFENDVVDITKNGNTIASVVFISTDADPDCNIYGKALNIEVKKDSPDISYPITRQVCGLNVPRNAIISSTMVIPIAGALLSGTGSGVSFRFQPATGFIGYGEIIYELGYVGPNFNGEIYESEAFVSGLVKITVIE